MNDTPPRPVAVRVNLDGIPSELRPLDQWVGWNYELRPSETTGKLEWGKVPKQLNGQNAKSNDPSTWSSFSSVASAYIDGKYDGIGFVFSADGHEAGVDLDACRDKKTGELTDWATEIIHAINTYVDVSPSAEGVKLVLRGRLPIPPDKTGRAKKLKGVPTYGDKNPEVAVYDKRRFWCLTGTHVNGFPNEPQDRQQQLDTLFAKYFGTKKRKSKSAASKSASSTTLDRLVDACRDAAEGDRSEEDFALCCTAIRRGWDKERIWSRVKTVGKFSARGRDYFDTTWSNAEARVAADDDIPKDVVSNGREQLTVDEDGKEKVVVYPLSMEEIIQRTRQQTDDWPRRVDSALFIHDREHGIAWLDKPPSLFGYLHRRVGKVTWYGGRSTVRQNELFAELQRTSERYVAVEDLTHEPMMDGFYYACEGIGAGDGKMLRELLSRFNPSTDIDGDLIKAAFMTPMWGGPPGTRPCFVITSDDGRGSGKSTLAEMIGSVYGGVLQFSHLEDVGRIKTRLLSPEALPRRVALLDNVKSLKFSWADLEGMITATSIGGHRMYVGEAVRPNTLVWFITLNGAALSTDMAQRAVIIKVSRPHRSATWEEDTRQFIREHQQTILGDIIGALRAPVFPLAKYSRWATWEKDVLQRLPEPGEAQKVILERQAVVDVDGEDAAIIEDYFSAQLAALGYDPQTERVFIPSQIAARWYSWATNEKPSVGGACRVMNQLITEGRLSRLARNVCNAWGRGFVWCEVDTLAVSHVALDLRDRIANRTRQQDA